MLIKARLGLTHVPPSNLLITKENFERDAGGKDFLSIVSFCTVRFYKVSSPDRLKYILNLYLF